VFRSHLTRRVKCDKTAKMLTKAHPTDYLSFIGAHSMEGPPRESTSDSRKWRQTRPARETKRAANNRPEFAQAVSGPCSINTLTPKHPPKSGRRLQHYFLSITRAFAVAPRVSHSLTRSSVAAVAYGVCDSFAHFFAPSASRRDDLSSPDKASQSCT
jgi:hypothetical protein